MKSVRTDLGRVSKCIFLMYHIHQITPNTKTPMSILVQFVQANKRFGILRWSVDEDSNFSGELTVSTNKLSALLVYWFSVLLEGNYLNRFCSIKTFLAVY